jgi:type I restriction enzyme S subunit
LHHAKDPSVVGGEVMTKPKWPEVRLGNILQYLDERVVLEDAKEYLTITVKRRHGGLEIREKLLGHQITTKKQFRIVPGAFIISRVQCWHRAYAIVGEVPTNAIASTNYDQFAISSEVDSRFFWWLSHSPEFTETVRSSASGVVIEKMVFDRNAWLEKTVRLPPVAEQRRIVARIEEIASQIEEARNLRKDAVEETRAVSRAWISFKLKPFASASIRLGDIVPGDSLRNGKSVKSSETGYGIRCLTLSAMRNGRIDKSLSKAIPLPLEAARPYLVKKNDVFIMRGNGSKDLCGLAGRAETDLAGVIFPDLFIRVSLPIEKVLPEFFVAVWNSPITRELIEESAKTTSGIWKINQTQILSTTIPVPPLSDQRRIMTELKLFDLEIDALKRLQAQTVAELDALLPSILDRAFSGKL